MNQKIDPTNGPVVAGVAIDPYRFVGRMKVAQLFHVAIDPRRTEDLRQREGDPQLEATYAIRKEVQRLFEGAKAKNVEPYARYIVAVHGGQDGMAPPIVLFTNRSLPHEERSEDGSGLLQVPWGTSLVAIDGETQLAARFEAASMRAETQNEFVPVVICHGRPLPWARQVFHDLNLLGVRPNPSIGLSMDERDLLTHAAREVESQVPFLRGRVNTARRQLRSRDREVITLTVLRGACVTFALGIGGVKFGAKPVFVDRGEMPKITARATEWFEAVTDTLRAPLEDRKNCLTSSPAVFAAIGAMGHELVAIDDDTARTARRKRLIDDLKTIKWQKDQRWDGIAGKLTPKGRFAVAGSKEVAYAVYRALTDSSDEGYARVRGQKSHASAATG